MATQFLALITVLSPHADNSLPMPQPPSGGPPGIWGPTDPRPSQPIYMPGAPVDPGYSPPWARPRPPGQPTHPIYNPPYPDNSLPGGQPYPDNSLPGGQGGRPTHPIYYPPYPDNSLPPFPSNPIYIPPEGAQPPLGIWGPTDPRPGYGLPAPQPHPEHPIVLPPDLPPTTPDGGKITWKVVWTPQTGWAVIGIPAEGTLVPTPSKK